MPPGGARRGGENLARERVGVGEEGLPEAVGGDALVELGRVDAAEGVDVERAAAFVGLRG